MLTIETIQHKHKPGIHVLIDRLNQVDHLAYSLTDEWLDYIIRENSGGIFIATCKGKVVGLATCMVNEMDKTHGVINIVVHPQYRNKGIGSQLHNKVIHHAKENNIKNLEAYIKKRLDKTVSFANKRGFSALMYAWEMSREVNGALCHLARPNNEALTFRKARENDSQFYASIIKQTFGDALASGVLKELLQDPSVAVYILEKEEAIGSLTIQFKSNLSTGYLYDIAILAPYRGQGFGSYMIEKAIEELKIHHIKTASLTVTGENKKALALYKRLGFEEKDMDILGQVSF